ncbi:glycosyl hydrolase family 18 protein [Jiella mangrovi]|uniref:GH18 domain-containing protein n=1 Tax=Jiella mangrovi TaxID=2821407 RepID=A0ABS4BL35_9HYPH|nr:glycosyl hydrolase family 18 protein [Jiella mangrovi]MBP0617429.1 hypothetical protein [Jiella mangrovi]
MAKEQFTAFWLGYRPSGPGKAPPLQATPDYIDVLVLAFSNIFPGNTTCEGFLQKSHTADELHAGIASLRQSNPNTKILLSIQGTPQPPVGWNTGITDPQAFGGWLGYIIDTWNLDGFDVDNEDLDSFPGQQFVDAVIGMRKAMPQAIITLDTYKFDRDKEVIKELAPYLTSINTIAYFLDYDDMTSLVEQYATVIDHAKISIGVKSAEVGPISQGTSVDDTAKLCTFEPSQGSKLGMTLWDLSEDITSVTGKPDGTWTRTIHEHLP